MNFFWKYFRMYLYLKVFVFEHLESINFYLNTFQCTIVHFIDINCILINWLAEWIGSR